MFHRYLLSATSCVCLLAQSAPTDIFQKAPPHVEEALRSRVGQFFQGHVDGKFRANVSLVAEDSQDAYFEMDKKRYLGFDIVKIDYTDNYTKAKVLTTVELMWRMSARVEAQRVKAPLLTTWKVENGEWFWYSVPSKEWDTPWGKMKFDPNDANDPAAKVVSEVRNMNPQAILALVRPSKTAVTLKSWEASSDLVEITNEMQGAITLSPDPSRVSGLDISVDRTTLKPGETARLSFKYSPVTKDAKPSFEHVVKVDPTGQWVKLDVNFSIPPEVQEKLKQQR